MNVGTNLNSSKAFTNEYYKLLCDDYPSFLDDYINTKEMQHINNSSVSCGSNYTNIFNMEFFYSNLDHSIAVALIIWNFTKDKKQTIAGLLHDIATPTFKHCVDFMNNDHELQESTEEHTERIIKNSKEIMFLLNRDNVLLEEVVDYKLYPIADNNAPKLSADRLEYTFSNGVFWKPVWDLNDIKMIYNDLIVVKNDEGIDELTFRTHEIAEFFVDKASDIWPTWINNADKVSMQFIADTLIQMNEEGFIHKDDLYTLTELEIIDKIVNCENEKISKNFSKFISSKKVYDSETFIENKYCKSIKAKKRYIDPLVMKNNETARISEVSNKSNDAITKYLKLEFPKYGHLDFDII